jgi:hypothetical protein
VVRLRGLEIPDVYVGAISSPLLSDGQIIAATKSAISPSIDTINTAFCASNNRAIKPMLRMPSGPIPIPTASRPSIRDRISGGDAMRISADWVDENAASPNPPIRTSGNEITNQLDSEKSRAGTR